MQADVKKGIVHCFEIPKPEFRYGQLVRDG